MAIDRHLAWLNVHINILDDQSKNGKGRSMLQRRKARYKRDILMEARKNYLATRKVVVAEKGAGL